MKKHLATTAIAAGILFNSFTGQASASELYTVKSGDSLWKISQNYNLTIKQLKQWNNLTSDTIYVNQSLNVTSPVTTQSASATHTVKSGDTLWGISRQYSTTVSSLKSLNALTSDTIYVGQVLKVSGTAAAPLVASAYSNVDALIAEAKKHVGSPYLWGGNTPAGFDCSGYLKYVFGKVGITIPRTVETIWSATKPVSTLKPGDIVFYETYKAGPSHAGIYLGSNKFIHASSSGVMITDMSNTYWKPRYLGARTAF